MRLLVTADWHLGRLFHQKSLIEDQAHVLSQVVDLAREAKPDVVVIAGDVYDRAVPNPEAVELFDEVLVRLAVEEGRPVFVVAGNHDSAKRLAFGARLLARSGVYVAGGLSRSPTVIPWKDEHGPVQIILWPYADVSEAQAVFFDPSDNEPKPIRDMEQAATAWLHAVRPLFVPGERRVLIGHAFVQGGTACESERPLSIGTLDAVPEGLFSDFHLVALGHLHRAQKVGERVRYPGSLLKYGFGEEDHKKGVSLIDLHGDGSFEETRLALSPLHDVRTVKAAFADILTDPSAFGPKDDYLRVVLTDREPVWDALTRLRDVFPNVLFVTREYLDMPNEAIGDRPDFRQVDEAVMVESFFRAMTPDGLNEEESTLIREQLALLRRAEREVTP